MTKLYSSRSTPPAVTADKKPSVAGRLGARALSRATRILSCPAIEGLFQVRKRIRLTRALIPAPSHDPRKTQRHPRLVPPRLRNPLIRQLENLRRLHRPHRPELLQRVPP